MGLHTVEAGIDDPNDTRYYCPSNIDDYGQGPDYAYEYDQEWFESDLPEYGDGDDIIGEDHYAESHSEYSDENVVGDIDCNGKDYEAIWAVSLTVEDAKSFLTW